MGEVIEFFGVTTYVCLWITALIGLAKWKLRITWLKPNYHFFFAVLALVFATTHLILIGTR